MFYIICLNAILRFSSPTRASEILDLTDNELHGSIPTEFGLFKDMEKLRLGGNILTGSIPSQLANMANLQELYLQVNE